jgi:hypothetical protein
MDTVASDYDYRVVLPAVATVTVGAMLARVLACDDGTHGT